MKYIVARNTVTQHWHVAVFSEFFVHSDIAAAIKKSGKSIEIVSAGFANPDDNGTWFVTDQWSESLGIGPRVDEDSTLITLWSQGYTGPDLANALAYIALQRKKR